ncbi:hypothetical protein J7M28_05690, partial [bacterium]|nr:hypothetical protein [bacterium]
RRIIRNSMAHADFYIYDETPFPEFMVFPRLGEKNSNDEPFFYDEQAISIYEELLDDCSSLALCLLFAEEKLGLLDSQQELSTQLSRRSMESKLHVILRCVLEPSGTMVKRAWSQRLNKIDTFYAELESGSSSYQTEIALKRANECGRALIQGDGFCASIESGTQAGEWATGMIESGDHLTKPDGMIFSQEKPGMAKKAVQEHWDGLRVHWEEHLTQLQGLKSHFNWPLAHKTPATHLDRSLKLDDTFQIVNAKGWPANEVKEVEFAIICPKAIERASLRKQIRDLVYTLRQLEVTFPNPHSHRHWKGKPAGMVTACFYMRRPREDVLISGRCSERKCAIAKIEWHNQGNCPYWIKPSESLPNKELPGPIHVEWSPRWESA